MDEITKLLRSMTSLLDSGINLAGGIVSDSTLPIHDEEWQQVVSASPKRQREFSCGRHYAHALLNNMGFPDHVISRDNKGCPLWPAGITGSISHTSNYCVAMIASEEDFTSLGVDLEEPGRMKASLWPRLFTQIEIARLENIKDPLGQMRQAAIIFSAKEAFYKCDYPINKRFYEFTDVEITIDETLHHLQLNVTASGNQVVYQGCYVTGMTHIMTVVYLTANTSPMG